MSRLTRYDPFSEPAADMFQGLFRPLRGLMPSDAEFLPAIRVDVSESDDSYAVKADIPGVKKDDIDIQVDGNYVSISANIERKQEQKNGERVIRAERYYGSVQRSFTLATAVDPEKVSASYENGTLSLTLPKKASAVQRKIAVR